MDASSRMPADRGLVGLGLMMQLYAGAQCIVGLALLVSLVFVGLPIESWLVVVLTHLAVAFAQLVAGTELRGAGLRSLSRVRAFVWTAAVAVVVRIGLLVAHTRGAVPWEGAVWVLLELLAWPATLAIVLHRPAMRAWFARVAEGEVDVVDRNRGLEATGAIMVALGASGAVCAGLLFYQVLVGTTLPLVPKPEYRPLLLVAVAGFLGRSLVHAHAGVRAMAGVGPAEFTRLVRRYVWAHWVSVVLALGAAAAAMLVASQRQRAGYIMSMDRTPITAMTAVMLAAVLGLLLLWPMILRSRAQQLGGDEDDATDFGRPADGGLVTLGWFLCAYAAGSLVPALAAALYGGYGGGLALGQLPGPQWYLDASLPSWLGLLGVALAAWAGIELCRMTTRARLAAIAFAAVTLALSLYTQLPKLGGIGSGLGGARELLGPVWGVLAVQSLLLSLVFPVLAVVMALRAPKG